MIFTGGKVSLGPDAVYVSDGPHFSLMRSVSVLCFSDGKSDGHSKNHLFRVSFQLKQ